MENWHGGSEIPIGAGNPLMSGKSAVKWKVFETVTITPSVVAQRKEPHCQFHVKKHQEGRTAGENAVGKL